MEDLKIGFIGFGQMGKAIANGMTSSCGVGKNGKKMLCIKKENIFYYTKSSTTDGYTRMDSNNEVVQKCDIIIIAVKPNIVSSVLKEVKESLNGKILLSVCAGLTLTCIESFIGSQNKIARIMPNTPCLVNESATNFCVNKNINDTDKQIIIELFRNCGIIEEASEKDMNILTALAGSGPAYVFLFIESLIDAGIKNGLNREIAKKMVLQTIKGSVKLVENSNIPVQQLKDNVCSPGGTTIEGLYTLEKNRFKFSIIEAVDSACEKSKSMAKIN